jgi:Xaa-Pro aminopeptidase
MKALPDASWQDCDSIVASLRLTKSARELAAMRAAGRVLAAISDGARMLIRTGRKEYEIVADIDRLARDKGVEDIRILAGDVGLRPPSFRQAGNVRDHWSVYLAVQHGRYWVEAGRTFVLVEDSGIERAQTKAREVVRAMAAELKPGGSVAAIEDAARGALVESFPTASVYGLGNGIGLDQWEAPFLNEADARQAGASGGPRTLAENMTLALRVALEADGKFVLFGESFEITASGARSLLVGE